MLTICRPGGGYFYTALAINIAPNVATFDVVEERE